MHNNSRVRIRLIEQLCKILRIHNLNKAANKYALFYDAIYYSEKSIRRTYNDLVIRLRTISDFQFQDPTDVAEYAITEAWTLVDSVYRLRRLLEDMPGLKQKSPQMKLFYSRTKCLKSLRDSIQHLDGFIDKYVPYKIPALGRLSWNYPINNNRYKACMIAPGDIQPDWKLIPSHMGKKMRCPVDFVTLTANNSVCLTHMIDALEQLIPWLNIQLDNNFNKKHQLIVICYGINVNYDILNKG